MTAFYNEIDPHAAQWLRELIKGGHIAPGVVDERDIRDITPAELVRYTQCHFFAGIGVWSYALRNASWSDHRPIWTGSCPCQPFSPAGRGDGFDDERHLWPHFHHLIAECRPELVLGEQVAEKDGIAWIDLVCPDLENTGYAVGATIAPAAGFGAPHMRHRTYWAALRVADDHQGRRQRVGRCREEAASEHGEADRLADDWGVQRNGRRSGKTLSEPGTQQRLDGCGDAVDLADAGRDGWRAGRCDHGCDDGRVIDPAGSDSRVADMHCTRREVVVGQQEIGPGEHCAAGGLVNNDGSRRNEGGASATSARHRSAAGPDDSDDNMADAAGSGWGEKYAVDRGCQIGNHPERIATGSIDSDCNNGPGPTNGYWGAADWLGCTDGKWRPVEPGSFPLAHGVAGRVAALRGYGNAIVAPQAQAFIETVMEVIEE